MKMFNFSHECHIINLQVIDLQTQLTHFGEVVELSVNKLGSQQSQQLLTDFVYMFSTGSNDYAFPYLTNPKKFPFLKNNFHRWYWVILLLFYR